MHADKISLVAKSDPIICQYGEDILRKHNRPHIKHLVSNKMRELGRMLICLEDTYGINSIFKALHPDNFDKVVSAVRIISGYEESEKKFKAPSLALHFRTTLLTISSTATMLLLKKDPHIIANDYNDAIKNVKYFSKLVESRWKYEMGSLALKDLTENQVKNPQKLPITEDVLLFNKYCLNVAEKAHRHLKTDLSINYFRELSESVLALTISINRKRVGDVQYTKLESYQSSDSKEEQNCINVLSDAEKELTKNFKRIVTIGKGSKPVPLLFPKKIQEYIDLLLSVRERTNYVPKENPFLFALTGSRKKWIDGSSTLTKFAERCGAKNPKTITSSRLRKQIATVLQILNLTEIEMEQIASFMGHTKKTHQEFYR